MSELVADRGYHSNDTMILTAATGCRTYISEPERGRRDWEDKEYAKQATYANRRRIKGTIPGASPSRHEPRCYLFIPLGIGGALLLHAAASGKGKGAA